MSKYLTVRLPELNPDHRWYTPWRPMFILRDVGKIKIEDDNTSGQAAVPTPSVSVKEDSNPAAGILEKGYESK